MRRHGGLGSPRLGGLTPQSSRESFNNGSRAMLWSASLSDSMDMSRQRTVSMSSSSPNARKTTATSASDMPTASTWTAAAASGDPFSMSCDAPVQPDVSLSAADFSSSVETPSAQTPREVLSSPVRVVVRFCPQAGDPQESPAAWVVDPGSSSVDTFDLHYHFHYDETFAEDATQEQVYETVGRPIVNDILHGYHGTVLAYGQTGTGKTYCIFGPPGPEVQGLVPRAAQHVFDYVGINADDKNKFSVECYFVEVYCEQLRDLLKPGNTKLQIKELPPKGCFIEGLTRRAVTSVNEVLQVLRFGLKQRAVANTRMNQHSSRSHAIFTLRVQQQTADGAMKNGKLTLVDLAGSEKVHKSCSAGDMLEEAKKINLSLSTLGHVIDALVDRRPHVPYRDSRLTRILEDSLGGNCRTTLLCTCSPDLMHFPETLSSLRFAARVKKVTNSAHINVSYACDKQLLNRIAHLRQELSKAHRKLERKFSTDSDFGSPTSRKVSHSRTMTQDTISEFLTSYPAPVAAGATKEDKACAEQEQIYTTVSPVREEEAEWNGDRQQMANDIQDLKTRLQVERQRSATLSFELGNKAHESRHLASQLEDMEYLARTQGFVSAGIGTLYGTTEMPIGTTSSISPRLGSTQVVRRVSRSATPARPSVASSASCVTRVHAPMTTASSSSLMASSSSSMIALCSTAASPKMPWASVGPPRLLGTQLQNYGTDDRADSPSRGHGAQSPSNPQGAHPASPDTGARLASPVRRQQSVPRQQGLGAERPRSVQRQSSIGTIRPATTITRQKSVGPGLGATRISQSTFTGLQSTWTPMGMPANNVVVFSPRQPVVKTMARMSSEKILSEPKVTTRWVP